MLYKKWQKLETAYSCLLDAYLMLTLFVWDIGTKKTKKRTNTLNLILDHSSLTFVNLSLA